MPSSSVSSTPDLGRPGWRERAVALAIYVVVAVLATWPLAWRPRTLLGAPQGEGDPYLNLFTLGWDLRQLFLAPSSWLNGGVFDAPIFHPARQTLAFTDHLLLQALLVSPIYAIWRDPVLCYNVVFIASLAASAWAMWWYLRQLLDDRLGPIVGGLAWGFCAYRFSHVLHLQLQALYFLPLAFGALHRVVARRRWQDGAWLGLWFGLTAVSAVYYAVIGLVALGLGGLALVAGAGRVSLGRLLAPLAVGGLVSAALVAPVLVPYVQAQQREGFVRTMDEASRHAATLASFVSDPPWRPVPLAPIGRTEEDGLLPGWGALALAVLVAGSAGAVAPATAPLDLGCRGRSRHRVRTGARGPAQRVCVGASLGLRLSGGSRAGAVRCPALVRRRRGGWLRGHVVAPRTAAGIGIPSCSPCRWSWRSRRSPGACPTFPLRRSRRPSVPGCAMRRVLAPSRFFRSPRIGPRRRSCSRRSRTAADRQRLQRPATGVCRCCRGRAGDVPVGRRDLDAARPRRAFRCRRQRRPRQGVWPLARRASVADRGGRPSVIYELADEATLLAAVGAPAAVSAPQPGVPGFAPGEVSRYDVFWDGAGTQVSAGTIEIAVLAATGSDARLPRWLSAADRARIRYEARVSLETAPWVARFFEARDVFRTFTDAEFRPIAHLREIREGRRQVDQSVFHDGAGGVVRVVPPDATTVEAGPGFRAPPDHRDPIAAFLLVRTLALAAGSEVAIPVNDMGRNLTLQSGPLAAETIEWRGQQVRALRMRPALVQRVQRRAPPAIDLWLSADQRRLPLRIDVAAGFGRVRVELIETHSGVPRT